MKSIVSGIVLKLLNLSWIRAAALLECRPCSDILDSYLNAGSMFND